MSLNRTPAVDWDSIHMESTNVLLHLRADEPGLHLVVIPREVLDDVTETRDRPSIELAREYRPLIDNAVNRAWHPDRLKHMVEVTGTGLRNAQLWLTRDDFA